MKKTYLSIALLLACTLFSCKKEDGVSCLTCISQETIQFDLCEENDGNASVNGENTGTPYAVYLDGLLEAGAQCN